KVNRETRWNSDHLDETLMASTSRSSVSVSVNLNISEDLINPAIKFNVDLPSSDETLKYQIKNLMNTEEMLNRQVAYLLFFREILYTGLCKNYASKSVFE
ncbi:MAG: hypothetical protein QM751_08510, partial [Paludibacteraceae bacterium]